MKLITAIELTQQLLSPLFSISPHIVYQTAHCTSASGEISVEYQIV